jgi:beta-lactamase class D
MLVVVFTVSARGSLMPQRVVEQAFAGRDGSLVLIECKSGETAVFRPEVAAVRIAPCSTFKIWNALCGLELGIVDRPEQPFYVWDGMERSVAAWNRNLTLKDAFAVSCVPAFQGLAQTIGSERMRAWLDTIQYGDQDISAGIDVFWLPASGRKTVLISPEEQAALIRRLVQGELPISEKSVSALREMMLVKRTAKGTLFGKTGSGANDSGVYVLGWYVGYVESGGTVYAYACVVRGSNAMGKDARAIVESVLERLKLL